MNSEELSSSMRRFMDPKELEMFDLAIYLEGETIRAQNAGAHLAACLMGASMNEAFLALMCLKYETDVMETKQYKYSTQKKKARAFREVLGDWKLEQFITVAEEREWIPADIVSEDVKVALAEGFRELMPITRPEMTEEEISSGAASFFAYPGTAMLRMTQKLRNAVHAGRWMRGKTPFVAEHFEEWCQFATRLSGEIRDCLLHLVLQRDSKKAAEKLSKLSEMLNRLPPNLRADFKNQMAEKLKDLGVQGLEGK
jgi:hypothetical protein